jgi:hypothetical protein
LLLIARRYSAATIEQSQAPHHPLMIFSDRLVDAHQ